MSETDLILSLQSLSNQTRFTLSVNVFRFFFGHGSCEPKERHDNSHSKITLRHNVVIQLFLTPLGQRNTLQPYNNWDYLIISSTFFALVCCLFAYSEKYTIFIGIALIAIAYGYLRAHPEHKMMCNSESFECYFVAESYWMLHFFVFAFLLRNSSFLIGDIVEKLKFSMFA